MVAGVQARRVGVVCPGCDWTVTQALGELARARRLSCQGCKARLVVEPEAVRTAVRRADRRLSLLRRFSREVVVIQPVVVEAVLLPRRAGSPASRVAAALRRLLLRAPPWAATFTGGQV